jgi:Helix-turn-helix domain
MTDNRDVRGDVRGEIREFLSTRRARITPVQAELPVYGGDRRRVSGLRRDEVALLAGISSQYYTRLERGNATGVSESVIDGISRALQLDEAERTHLLDLIRAAAATSSVPAGPPMTSRSTPPASRFSTTRSSGTSTCRTTPFRWPPIPARASSPTPPSPGRPPRTPSTCWPAGPRPHTASSRLPRLTPRSLLRNLQESDLVGADDAGRLSADYRFLSGYTHPVAEQ